MSGKVYKILSVGIYFFGNYAKMGFVFICKCRIRDHCSVLYVKHALQNAEHVLSKVSGYPKKF